MSWIDEEVDKQKRRQELCGHAAELRNAVWREIQAMATEARGKVPGASALMVDDQVRFPQVVGGGAPKSLTVEVGKDGCSVTSSNGKKFPLGYNGDSPSLMEANSSRAVSIEEAAELILKAVPVWKIKSLRRARLSG